MSSSGNSSKGLSNYYYDLMGARYNSPAAANAANRDNYINFPTDTGAGKTYYDLNGNQYSNPDAAKSAAFDQNWTNTVTTGTGTGAGSNTGGEKGWVDEWFGPQGNSGRSLAGNVLGGVASGVGALSGLAGMYYGYEQMKMQKDMNKLQKDAYNRQVKKDEQQEARLKQLAKNVGNSATY